MTSDTADPMNETTPRTIVLVGHCIPDAFMLKTAVKRAVPGATIKKINSSAKLEPYLRSDAVLLVNRELDGRFDSAVGIELIERTAQRADPPILVLISNFPEAQQQAVQAGARPGFGKSQLYDPATADLLRDAAG